MYDSLRLAVTHVLYDNGMVNRHMPPLERQVDESIADMLATFGPDALKEVDAELSALTQDEVYAACTGEESEMQALISEKTNTVLNHVIGE